PKIFCILFIQAHNIPINPSNESIAKLSKLDSTNSLSSPNLSYDTPKRTRFSFKPEHLVILETCFVENQYPDQKKREELAKMCNEARPCSERERVTEQIITHWFQNKRKISRKGPDEPNKSPNVNMIKQEQEQTDSNSPYGYQDYGDDSQKSCVSPPKSNMSDEEQFEDGDHVNPKWICLHEVMNKMFRNIECEKKTDRKY
ncbi:homeobox-containing 1-like isoform X1, partial [Brachionus plicatilis]